MVTHKHYAKEKEETKRMGVDADEPFLESGAQFQRRW